MDEQERKDLLDHLHDADPSARIHAVQSCADDHWKVVEQDVLKMMVDDPDQRVRRTIVDVIGLRQADRTPPDFTQLYPAAGDADWNVRYAVASHLRGDNLRHAFPVLMELLDDEDSLVRNKAEASLVRATESSETDWDGHLTEDDLARYAPMTEKHGGPVTLKNTVFKFMALDVDKRKLDPLGRVLDRMAELIVRKRADDLASEPVTTVTRPAPKL